jgi:Probable lipid transfer
MATKLQIRAITLACIMILFSVGDGRATKDCKVDKVGLISCLPAISGTHPDRYPSPDCCNALKSADLPCLCSYKNSPDLKKLGIKPDLAVKLPKKCHLAVPNECH